MCVGYGDREQRFHPNPRIMSIYQGRYTQTAQGVYTLIVRVESDGYEQVLNGFGDKHYTTLASAEKAVAKYLAKEEARRIAAGY